MSEFEDREKNLGNLPEDIMRERGEWPIGKPGRARRSNIPPDVESRGRAVRGDEIDRAPEDRAQNEYGVTSVFEARPVDGVDFIRQDSDVDTAVSKANFSFGDYVETLFTYTGSEDAEPRYGMDFYNGNYYIVNSAGDEKAYVFSPSGEILFEFELNYPLGGPNANVSSTNGITVVRNSKGDVFYYIACGITDGVGNKVLVYDAGGNFVQEATGFSLDNGESGWDGIDFQENTNKIIYGSQGGYLYYGALNPDSHEFTLEKDFRPDTSARDVSFIYPDDNDLILYLTEAGIIKVVRISDETSPDSFDAEIDNDPVRGVTIDNEGYIIAGIVPTDFYLVRYWPYDSDSKDVIDLSASFTVPESYVAVIRNIAYTLSPLFGSFDIGDIVARVKINNRTIESVNALNSLVEDEIKTYFLADEGDEVSIDLKVNTVNVMTTSSLYRIAFELNAFFTGNLLIKRGRELQYEPVNKRRIR